MSAREIDKLGPGTPEYARPLVSPVGFLLAAIFFGASLTPSLIPRDPLLQGALSGAVAIVGYEIGLISKFLWRFLQLPRPPRDLHFLLGALGFFSALGIGIFCLYHAAYWQNATRAVMDLEPVETSFPLRIFGVALVVFVLLWAVFRAFGYVLRRVSHLLGRLLPPRIGLAIGFALVLWLFWAVFDGVLFQNAFRAADASFEAADRFVEPDIPRPADPLKTGSDASLIDWQEMGRWGRAFVTTGPTAAEISEFQPGALEPVRVYVGRRAAETARERAELALAELIRAGGFERSNLVVVVPVGTGWMDPGAQDTLDFMLGGDVATVAVQYSYLTSVLSLMAHPEYGTDQARELFDVIYEHWLGLPGDSRPRLYVHGLSQGAYNSEATLPLLDMLGDPINGALWAGSPFFSRFWYDVRTGRQPDSPAWRPRFGNGSLARVYNQNGAQEAEDLPWGPVRMVFLSYGSDPIVAFDPETAFQPPDWTKAPRAFDVSPELRWFPLITTFQLAADMVISLRVPGFGHYYVARDYIDAWAELLDPPDWSPERDAALKAIFARRAASGGEP